MAQALGDQIMDRIEEAGSMYHRLVLVVAPSGSGKTESLRDVAERSGALIVNVNLELSKRMLELTERQRALQAARILAEIVGETQASLVLLDNTEVLFDPGLRQDPIRLLQSLSRNRTIVAAWNGASEEGQLAYAKPGHPEHVRVPAKEFLCVCGTAAGP